jgi:hypothetical protein
MRKIILKLLCFAGILYLLLFSVQCVIDNRLHKVRSGEYGEWNDIYQSKINADMIVLGASRAWLHVSPRILDSVLGINSYNLGMDGYYFRMEYYRLKIYLEHNKKPKYILHSIDEDLFTRNKGLYRPEQFPPYLNDPLIREATSAYEGRFGFTDYTVPLVKYLGRMDLAQFFLSEYFQSGQLTNIKYKGFKAQDRRWDGSFDAFKKNNPNGQTPEIDPETKLFFEDYLNYCTNNNIQVFFVFSPEYYEVRDLYNHRDSVMNMYKAYAKKYNAVFVDYSHDSICQQQKYFYNSKHMNITGAKLFSTRLAQDLKKYIPGQ